MRLARRQLLWDTCSDTLALIHLLRYTYYDPQPFLLKLRIDKPSEVVGLLVRSEQKPWYIIEYSALFQILFQVFGKHKMAAAINIDDSDDEFSDSDFQMNCWIRFQFFKFIWIAFQINFQVDFQSDLQFDFQVGFQFEVQVGLQVGF